MRRVMIFGMHLMTGVLMAAEPGAAVDKCGGVLSVKGKATGRFHLETINGRDCLVTPDGHGFRSLGVNHIQAIHEESKVDLFADQYGRDWTRYCKDVHTRLNALGFNTGGYGTPAPLGKLIPFMQPCYLTTNANYMPPSKFKYQDIFDPKVQREIKKKIAWMVRSAKGNPNLIGYYWTDTPQWDINRARKKRKTDWVSAIRALPATAPGRIRYEKFLREKYKDGLPNGYRPKLADDIEFLRLIARELYSLIGKETRRLDPDALIFGERYLVGDHPDVVLEEAVPYIDVLSIQPGGRAFRADYFDELHRKTGKPINLCDHQCSFAVPDYPKTMWQQLESEEAVGKAYAKYLEDAFRKSYIIAYHRCQYIDRFAKHPGVLKQGLLREDGTPYKTLATYVAKANRAAIRALAPQQ